VQDHCRTTTDQSHAWYVHSMLYMIRCIHVFIHPGWIEGGSKAAVNLCVGFECLGNTCRNVREIAVDIIERYRQDFARYACNTYIYIHM
jgi:hypothetical protein